MLLFHLINARYEIWYVCVSVQFSRIVIHVCMMMQAIFICVLPFAVARKKFIKKKEDLIVYIF